MDPEAQPTGARNFLGRHLPATRSFSGSGRALIGDIVRV